MADSKISALPAVVTPLSTDEFAVNQGGVSKKETGAQIVAGGVKSGPGWDKYEGLYGNETLYQRFNPMPAWTWGNQGTSTFVANVLNGLGEFNGQADASSNLRAFWSGVTVPAAGDWIWAAKMGALKAQATQIQYGVIALTAGSVAAPTGLTTASVFPFDQVMAEQTWANYTTFSITPGSLPIGIITTPFWIGLAWDQAGGTVYSFYGDTDCGLFISPGNTSIAKPTDLGIFVEGGSASQVPSFAVYNAKLVPVAAPVAELDFRELAGF